jgi:gluconate 2-dehydrogenase gamma chain
MWSRGWIIRPLPNPEFTHSDFESAGGFMPGGRDDQKLSRRELLKRAGFASAAAVIPGGHLGPVGVAAPSAPVAQSPAGAAAVSRAREPLETLTAAEAETLEAICARLIPTDENGPGAAEARAAHYIDRALGSALAASRAAYSSGLAALDTYARASKSSPFAKLSTADQDRVLTDLEQNVATGFTQGASNFFNLVRGHTLQGTFCDPYYGGNANFVGWDLVGYPGVRLTVGADEQRMTAPKPNHKSAYDYTMFSKTGMGDAH